MKQNKPIEKIDFGEKFPTKDEITKLYMNQMQLGQKVNEILDYLFPEEGEGNSYQAGYDAGAAEATQVCNDKTVPQAHKEGREEMKAELREELKKIPDMLHVRGEETYYLVSREDILNLLS